MIGNAKLTEPHMVRFTEAEAERILAECDRCDFDARATFIRKCVLWICKIIDTGMVPEKVQWLQALQEKRAVTEIPATSDLGVAGSGLAGAEIRTAAVRRPRLDAFHVILAATFSAFQRNPELERV